MSKTDTLLKVGLGAGVVAVATDTSLPQLTLPEWTPLAVVAVAVGAVAAHVAAGKILALLPEDEWDIYLHEVRKDDGTYLASWGMTRDYWQKCVVNRQLNEVEERGPGHFECYRFNPDPDWWDDDREGGVVWGTWRGQKPDSHIVGNITVEDAWREIKEMTDGLEDDAAAARVLIREYPSIIRRMDRERAVRFVNMVGGDVAGEIQERDVDEILADHLPEDLRPRILLDESESDDGDESDDVDPEDLTTGQALARLVDGPTGPPDPAASADQPVATDGSGEQ